MKIAAAALALAFASVAVPVSIPASAHAGVLYLNSCSGYGDNGYATDVSGQVWQGVGNGAYGLVNRCAQGGSFQIVADQTPSVGANAQWSTVTPPSIEIVHALTPVNEVLIDPHIKSDGYNASFFWNGGTQGIVPENNCCGVMYYGSGINRSLGPSRYFGFQVTCFGPPKPCNAPLGELVDVRGVQLEAVDDTFPTLLALGSNNLFYQGASWVRGAWPASFVASDDSGICNMRVVVKGQSIQGPADPTPNQHSWTQCPSPATMSLTIDTSSYPNGPLPLTFVAADAASPSNVAWPTAALHVDNQPVVLSLSGPSDAPSTEGTQHVTAIASAGPSGVAGIDCSADGSRYQWHRAARVDIPVQGLGEHRITCYAQNNSINSSRAPARSQTETWTLSIRKPSISTISFSRVVKGLRCVKKRERIHVPARWVTVKSHGHPVRVRVPAQTRTITVVRCHPRASPQSARHVAHGAATTISGWLGTAQRDAIGGQRVRILAAPDDGKDHFSQAAVATTAANGTWSARIAAGPSRLIEAAYGGNATIEPSTSAPAHLVVPAAVSMRIHPHSTHWGDAITIDGRLRGGYIPPAGELVVLWIGWPGGSTEIGHLYTARSGQFHSTYTFLRGNGTETYHLWAATARESDYPYAPHHSRKVSVTVRP